MATLLGLINAWIAICCFVGLLLFYLFDSTPRTARDRGYRRLSRKSG